MTRAAQLARELEQLLGAQAQALRDNRADDLAGLANAIQRSTRELAAHARAPVDPSLEDDLRILQRLAGNNATWLARRRNAAAAALQTLGASSDHLRQQSNAQTYGSQGELKSPALRGGFGRA